MKRRLAQNCLLLLCGRFACAVRKTQDVPKFPLKPLLRDLP